MKDDPKDLSQKENQFIAETIEKELFFSISEGEENPLTQLVCLYVELERNKLECEHIDSDNYAKDIATADSILDKLTLRERAK